MSEKSHGSIEQFYDMIKNEYSYQRERMQKLESKVELIISIVNIIFALEIGNSFKVLSVDFSIDSFEMFKKFILIALNNIPYVISLISFVIVNIGLILIIVNIKCKIVNLNFLRKNDVYKEDDEVFYCLISTFYCHCIDYNLKRINGLYKATNAMLIMSVLSVLFFGFAFLF